MKRYLKWNKLKQVFGLFQWTNTIFVDWKVHLQFSPDGNGILNIKFNGDITPIPFHSRYQFICKLLSV